MKCKACDGRGVLVASIYENDEVGFVDKTYQCCCCHGTGEIEQTNEEWLRNLSFNEFARVLYCMIINGERIRPDLAYIKKWLKEKHDE